MVGRISLWIISAAACHFSGVPVRKNSALTNKGKMRDSSSLMLANHREGIRRHTSFRIATLRTWRCDAMRVWNALRRDVSSLFDLLKWHRRWQLGKAYWRLYWTSHKWPTFFSLFVSKNHRVVIIILLWLLRTERSANKNLCRLFLYVLRSISWTRKIKRNTSASRFGVYWIWFLNIFVRY